MALSRDDIARAASVRCRVRPVEVAGLGTLGIRIMRGHEQVQFAKEFRGVDENEPASCYAFALRWLVRLLCDEGGARLYADGEEDALQDLGTETVMAAFTAAAEANGFGPKEGIEQDFPKTPTASGGSA